MIKEKYNLFCCVVVNIVKVRIRSKMFVIFVFVLKISDFGEIFFVVWVFEFFWFFGFDFGLIDYDEFMMFFLLLKRLKGLFCGRDIWECCL